MKSIFLLLAIVALAVTGCNSTDSNMNNNGMTNSTDNGMNNGMNMTNQSRTMPNP
jgi:outer membrane lipoprotein SlyB